MDCSPSMSISQDIKTVAKELGVDQTVISGEDLQKGGFGGVYGVGKAASHPPVLAILSHTPPGATKTIAWVGKGIVYDTGGLSLKDKVRSSYSRTGCDAVLQWQRQEHSCCCTAVLRLMMIGMVL